MRVEREEKKSRKEKSGKSEKENLLINLKAPK